MSTGWTDYALCLSSFFIALFIFLAVRLKFYFPSWSITFIPFWLLIIFWIFRLFFFLKLYILTNKKYRKSIPPSKAQFVAELNLLIGFTATIIMLCLWLDQVLNIWILFVFLPVFVSLVILAAIAVIFYWKTRGVEILENEKLRGEMTMNATGKIQSGAPFTGIRWFDTYGIQRDTNV